MPQMFVQTAEQLWAPVALREDSYELRALLVSAVSGGAAGPLVAAVSARVVSFRDGAVERWMVVAGPDAQLRVNGIPLGAVGARVLGDRDELAIPGVGSAYYSTESLAEVVDFPGLARVVLCGRCRQEVVRGHPAARCVGCGTWYHETPELKCFTYSEICNYCPAATVPGRGL